MLGVDAGVAVLPDRLVDASVPTRQDAAQRQDAALADLAEAKPAPDVPDAALSRSTKLDAATTRPKKPRPAVRKPRVVRNEKPARQYGRLVVNPGPNLAVSYARQGGRGSQSLKLRKEKGRVFISDRQAGLSIRLDYKVVGQDIRLSIDSTPWVIVRSAGLGLGKTPQTIGPKSRFSIELKNPKLDPVKIIIFYRASE